MSKPNTLRLLTIVLYICLLAISFISQQLLLSNTNLFGPAYTTVATTAVIILAIGITGTALVQYTAQRHFIFILIILGFSGAAILELIYVISPENNNSNWYLINHQISQIWLTIVFAVHLWISNYQIRNKQISTKQTFLLGSTIATIGLTIFFTILSNIVSRLTPAFAQTDLILISLILLTLIAYLVPQLRKSTPYREWITVFLILTVIGQITMLNPKANAPEVSTIFQILSYLSILLGILITIYETLKTINEQQTKVNRKNLQLTAAQNETNLILQQLQEKESELQKRILELKINEKDMKILVKELGTSKEKAEKEKARDEAILANLGESLIVTDKTGLITKANESAAALLNIPIEQMVGKSWLEISKFIDKNHQPYTPENDLLMTMIQSGNKLESHDTYIRHANLTIPVYVTASPIKLLGFTIGGVLLIHDITEQKRIDQAKTEFVSLASHQLRTPLSTIKWYTELLLAGDAGQLNEEQTSFLNEVYQGNERMIDLVNALLNVSRLELGTFAVDPEPTNIIEIAESVRAEVQHEVDQKNIQYLTQYSSDIPTMQADPKLLRIIVQNLITNAIKYTPEKGTITVSLNPDTQTLNQESIMIKVADTGFGIPNNQKKYIFTKLFRADNVKIKDTQGTGLGLYIIKAIVDNSQGKIWFESQENHGTTFFVVIPLNGMQPKQGTKSIE